MQETYPGLDEKFEVGQLYLVYSRDGHFTKNQRFSLRDLSEMPYEVTYCDNTFLLLQIEDSYTGYRLVFLTKDTQGEPRIINVNNHHGLARFMERARVTSF
jgi:hypothetical protein